MIDLSKYNNYVTEPENDDSFFLDRGYHLIERFGLWGRKNNFDDSMITRAHVYRRYSDIVNGFPCEIEGIEIVWEGNPFGIDHGDYYKKIR